MLRCHVKSPTNLPAVWLMTDERVKKRHLLAAVRRLPGGSGVVLRHHSWSKHKRHALFRAIRVAARGRGIRIIVAGKQKHALRWGADGWHARAGAHLPRSTPKARSLLRSAPVHDMAQLRAAESAGVDLIFLSPLFATRSHPGARPLGPFRFAAIARRASMPVMALGGVHPRHSGAIRRLGAAGFGAIDGLVDRP